MVISKYAVGGHRNELRRTHLLVEQETRRNFRQNPRELEAFNCRLNGRDPYLFNKLVYPRKL